MPRLSARRHSLRVSKLHTHNLIEQERQVLRSPFMCVSLRKQQTVYAATLSTLCGVLFLAWRPTHFLIKPNVALSQLLRHCKRYNPWGCRFKQPLRGSAMNQCNKLHLLYRLTSERVQQLNSIGEQPSSCSYNLFIRTFSFVASQLQFFRISKG